MGKLVIHAGFAKAGSTTVQGALMRNMKALCASSIYVFDADLQLSLDGEWRGLPPWALEVMRRTGGLYEKIVGQVKECEGVIVLSAENLGTERFPEFFKNMDSEIEVEFICYFRPYHSVIPSSWQQWGTKTGTPLADYVENCISTGEPAYRRSLEAWREALPRSRISVIPFVGPAMRGGNPASDFLSRLGFPAEHERHAHSNASYDYALMDLFCREADQLFFERRVHPATRLKQLLPPEYCKTNALIISREWAERIERRFRADTLFILRNFSDIDDVEEFYKAHFMPEESEGHALIDMESRDVLARAFVILMDVLGEDEMSRVLGEALAAHLKRNSGEWIPRPTGA
ncbi:MAG: hypothetical protein L0H23_03380 [Luteimonas sp.]|nr:hypothetical protein [Luteimonas sp.]